MSLGNAGVGRMGVAKPSRQGRTRPGRMEGKNAWIQHDNAPGLTGKVPLIAQRFEPPYRFFARFEMPDAGKATLVYDVKPQSLRTLAVTMDGGKTWAPVKLGDLEPLRFGWLRGRLTADSEWSGEVGFDFAGSFYLDWEIEYSC